MRRYYHVFAGKEYRGHLHAMLPSNPGDNENLTYVDTAVRHLYRKMVGFGD